MCSCGAVMDETMHCCHMLTQARKPVSFPSRQCIYVTDGNRIGMEGNETMADNNKAVLVWHEHHIP